MTFVLTHHILREGALTPHSHSPHTGEVNFDPVFSLAAYRGGELLLFSLHAVDVSFDPVFFSRHTVKVSLTQHSDSLRAAEMGLRHSPWTSL